jgi:hypothetical protein
MGDDMTQPGQNTRPAEAAAAKPTPPVAVRPGIRALIDNATADRLYGWAWNAAEPDRRLSIELRLADETVAATTADLARPDLANNGIGDGCHAFEFPLRPEWIARRGELSAVVRCEDGAEVPVAVRVRRPDDAQVSTRLQRAVEGLAAEQAALRREVAERPDATAAVAERLDQLELWVARLDARLGDAAAPPKAGASAGGLDPWQAALAAVLASAASAALALAVSRVLG